MADREQISSSESYRLQFESLAKGLRTSVVCQVVNFDDALNRVDLQPVNRTMVNGELYDMPIINHVPVAYMGAKDLWITIFPEPGDLCIALISDRSLDNWKMEGGLVDPATDRHHDLSDAIALFGINPYPKAIEAIEPETIHVRTRDGVHGIKVRDSHIEIHSDQSTVITTPDLIEIQTPTSTIAVEADTITIDTAGTSVITLDSAGEVTIKAAALVTVETPIVEVTGQLVVAGTITGEDFISTGNSTNYNNHRHGDVENGPGVSGEPE